MSWDCAIAHLANTSLDELYAAGLTAHGRSVTCEETTIGGFDDVGASEWRGAVILSSSDLTLTDGLPQLARMMNTTVTGTTFGGTSDTYIFEQHTATATRRLVAARGTTIRDEGTPHPAERGNAQLDEYVLFQLLKDITGFTVDNDWQAGTCQPITWPPSDGMPSARSTIVPGEPAPRRRWWKFRPG